MSTFHFAGKDETVTAVGETSNLINQAEDPPGGLTIFMTSMLIVGVITGSGFLSLPMALDNSSFLVGFPLLFIFCILSAYTAHVLGKCWTVVLELKPEMQQRHIRYPYQAIGEQAFGKYGRYIEAFSISFPMFGATIMYVLQCAEHITNILGSHYPHAFCYVVLIVICCVTPFTLLGTPKDFWGIAMVASIASVIASVILFGLTLHNSTDVKTVEHREVTFKSFVTAYGIFSLAYCGHPAFPTFQTDMKEPSKFGGAVLIGYIIVFLTYVPSTTAVYFVYGKDTASNVLYTMSDGTVSRIVTVFMTAHLFFGVVVVINPVMQDLEHACHVPERCTWKRLVTRTLTMAAVLFVAESVPHFSSILALIGGSTISVLSYVCPSIFYIRLRRKINRPLSVRNKVFLYGIIIIGMIAGLAATISAIMDLWNGTNKLTVPCYVDHIKAWRISS